MFKDTIKALRKERGLTQTELAEVVGFTHVAVVKWENGQREPDFSTLIKLADYFGVSTDYLLGRETNDADISSNNRYQSEPELDPLDENECSWDKHKSSKISIINSIIEAIKINQISIRDLSIKSGISEDEIYAWIHGKYLPDAYELKSLSLALDVSADCLIGHKKALTTLSEVMEKDHFILQRPDYEIVAIYADKYGLLLADEIFKNATKLFNATMDMEPSKGIQDRISMVSLCEGYMEKAGYDTKHILDN